MPEGSQIQLKTASAFVQNDYTVCLKALDEQQTTAVIPSAAARSLARGTAGTWLFCFITALL